MEAIYLLIHEVREDTRKINKGLFQSAAADKNISSKIMEMSDILIKLIHELHEEARKNL